MSGMNVLTISRNNRSAYNSVRHHSRFSGKRMCLRLSFIRRIYCRRYFIPVL